MLAPGGSLDEDLAAIGPAARVELVHYLEAAAALDGRLAPEEAAILARVRMPETDPPAPRVST